MEDLIRTFIEEYEGGKDEAKKERYRNATILFSKAMFALCDFVIYEKLKRLPKNHTERFRILEEYFNDIYGTVDEVFGKYQDTYTKPALEESCKEIKDAIRKIKEASRLPEEARKIIE